MIQEATSARPFMINIAEFVLDDVYELFEAALGSAAAWWVGHLTLIGLTAALFWALRNWEDLAYGFEISGMKVWSMLVVVGLFVGQHWMYQSMFGFPGSGAFLTSLMVTGYLVWQWYQLEPAKA
jgi:hypothetical protein